MFGVYIHIPFCKTLCPYCDFVKQQLSGVVPRDFITALCTEITEFSGPDAVESIFFGGGTPSLLAPNDLEIILDALHKRFKMDAPEVTIEANPDDITENLVLGWREIGINRVSLGVQSFDEAVLRYLGRRHGVEAALQACEYVANRFDNWSMDLIFGAPPIDAWNSTLEQCRTLCPPHISAYGLTYESATPFGKRKSEAISDDASLDLYKATEEILAEYTHYEISNYALSGKEARHNLIYWYNESYAGFGPGAYSFVNGVRARNLANVAAYCNRPGEKSESLTLSEVEIKVETLIQHFRLSGGLSKLAYKNRFSSSVEEDFGPQLNELINRGLLIDTGAELVPTSKGFYLNNEIGLTLV